jgi:hypothetical protein
VPGKTVVQYSCSRCPRVWYEEQARVVAKLIVRLTGSDGEEVVHADYDTLCESCEKTVRNYVKGLIRDLKKISSTKVRAKKGGDDPPTESEDSTSSDPSPERDGSGYTPEAVNLLRASAYPKRQ